MKNHKDGLIRQVLTIDDDKYLGDNDMDYLLRRLVAAASDSKLRHDMNVEDEFFSAIENRDTAIMARDKRIEEQDALLSEQSAMLSEKDALLSEQNDLLKNMVKSMLSKGMSIDDIAMLAGKSVEDVEQIVNI